MYGYDSMGRKLTPEEQKCSGPANCRSERKGQAHFYAGENHPAGR